MPLGVRRLADSPKRASDLGRHRRLWDQVGEVRKNERRLPPALGWRLDWGAEEAALLEELFGVGPAKGKAPLMNGGVA